MTISYQEAVEKTIIASEQLNQIVNGTATAEVVAEDGSKIPSIRKALVDNFYFKDPLPWQQGQSETVFNQLRKFSDGTLWYAPTATASHVIPMGATPIGDPLWKVYSLDAIPKLTPQIREALRRTYAEAGLVLVDGSFEDGAKVVTKLDVVLECKTGKGYNWQGNIPTGGKVIPSGSTPTSTGGIGADKWQDLSNVTYASQRELTEGKHYTLYRTFEAAVTLTQVNEAVQFSVGGIFYRWDGAFPQGGLAIPQGTPEPSPDQIGAGKYIAVLDLGIKDWADRRFARRYKCVSDMTHGVPTRAEAGDICVTEGYHSPGDGGGFMYQVRTRVGGYGQAGTVIIPLDSDELQAVPLVDVVSAPVAGILPSIANDDNTKRFNDLASFAKSRGQKYVSVPSASEYFVAGDLSQANNIIFTGPGTLVSPVKNNYYKRIYPEVSSKGVVRVNSINKALLYRFLTAIRNRTNSSGILPVVVFVGDSLTQGGHRAADNYWWVKHMEDQLVNQFGPIRFYNRGIAGSGVSQIDSIVQTDQAINAPFEPRWNNTPNKLYRDYIAELNPDLVIIAYGMNSAASGADTYAISRARANLRTLMPTTDFVWLTTPIRTTDTTATVNGAVMGTYPRNEQSNTAGLVTRYLAKKFGDYCIDVNRVSNIVQLGQDPECTRMNRWAGQYRSVDNKFSNPQNIVVEADGTWTVNLDHYGEISSSEMFRDAAIEFTVSSAAAGTLEDLRISMRADSDNGSEILWQFTKTEINLVAYKDSAGKQATWSLNPLDKRFRIEVIGPTARVYIDGVLTKPTTGDASGLFGSMFLSPITISTKALGPAKTRLTDFVVTGVSRYDLERYTPLLTPYEIFSVQAGDGGNNVNHPNTRGELAMYAQAINEFVGDCAMLYSNPSEAGEVGTQQKTVSVPGAQGNLVLQKRVGMVLLTVEDFSLAGNDGGTPIVRLPDQYLPELTASSTLANIEVSNDTKRIQVRQNGDVYIQGGTGSAKYAGQVAYTCAT